MRKWVELAERCEQATGPDRKIDAAMAKALGLVPSGLTPGTSRGYEARFSNSTVWIWDAPYYTASLNAITALIDRELPGSMRSIRKHPDGEAVAQVWNSQVVGETPRQRWCCASEALALCAAFCRAMNEKEANA